MDLHNFTQCNILNCETPHPQCNICYFFFKTGRDRWGRLHQIARAGNARRHYQSRRVTQFTDTLCPAPDTAQWTSDIPGSREDGVIIINQDVFIENRKTEEISVWCILWWEFYWMLARVVSRFHCQTVTGVQSIVTKLSQHCHDDGIQWRCNPEHWWWMMLMNLKCC